MYCWLGVLRTSGNSSSCLCLQLHQVERLKVRIQVMMFMGNFDDDMALLAPVSESIQYCHLLMFHLKLL